MKILAIEPYFGLSHRTFLEGYRKYSRHEVTIWSLSPRKWKWRMRGSAYHFAEQARALEPDVRFDRLLVSDFLNLPDFLALAPPRLRELPVLAYFHENQINYPLAEHAPVDYHYGWINLSTAFAADRVLFNSYYHREEFLNGIRTVLERMPDYRPQELIDGLVDKSLVFPVGIDFADHDAAMAAGPGAPRRSEPTILWNHRWEYDKGPETFFDALVRLRDAGAPFRLVVCGQSFKNCPAVFEESRRALEDRVDHFGFLPDYRSYLDRIRRCDVVVSTAVHEFFGVSVLDGIYCGCLPVLPRRLSYREIIPPHLHPLFLYERDEDLVEFLGNFLEKLPVDYRDELREHVAKFDWRTLSGVLDRELEDMEAR